MKVRHIIFICSLVWWLIVTAAVVRVHYPLFGAVTVSWRNLQEPNAVFHWTATPDKKRRTMIPAGEMRVFKVSTPMAWRQATLRIEATADAGSYTINVSGLPGQSDLTATASPGSTLVRTITINANQLAVKTLTISCASYERPVGLRNVSLTFKPL